MNLDALAESLTRVVEDASAELRALDDTVVGAKAEPGVWSAKEILGHLVDSAANNHQRFVRAQQSARLVFPKYEQDAWVAAQDYQSCSWTELVEFWRLYNRHLAHLIRHIRPETLNVECVIEPYSPVSLEYLIEDYIAHLQHHLKQIRARTRSSH